MAICLSCGKGCIEPKINSSTVLIIKDMVTQNEVKSGIPFVTSGLDKYGRQENTTSYYLAREFGLVGLRFSDFSCTNFYNHILPSSKKKKDYKDILEKCYEFSLNELIKVTVGKKIIFMMGASVIKLFTGYNATDVYGLVCKSELLPWVPVIIPSPNSDKMMLQPIGEFRNAINMLSEQIKILEEYNKIGV